MSSRSARKKAVSDDLPLYTHASHPLCHSIDLKPELGTSTRLGLSKFPRVCRLIYVRICESHG